MKLRNFRISVILAFVLVMNLCSFCLANPTQVSPTVIGSDSTKVTPRVIGNDSWVFNFSPNYIARNTYTYPTGTAHGASYMLADAYFKMMLDPYLDQPTIYQVAGGLPQTSFTQQYDSTYGGNCWLYTSGLVWYNGSVDFKLKAKTKSSYMGSYLGKWGSYNMSPNGLAVDTLYINS